MTKVKTIENEINAFQKIWKRSKGMATLVLLGIILFSGKYLPDIKTESQILENSPSSLQIKTGDNSPVIVNNIDSRENKKTLNKNKMKLPPTTAELENNFREQIQFLITSSENFDKGMESEAKRIASTLYILFANNNETPSLIEQLRISDSILLPNTVNKVRKGNLAPYMGLLTIKMTVGQGITYEARSLVNAPGSKSAEMIKFEKWWRTVILDDRKGNIFTRESLVTVVAEQDGGIHVANNLEPSYVNLARKSGIGWRDGKDNPILGAELHSLRQIAWEVLDAISKQYPQFLPN